MVSRWKGKEMVVKAHSLQGLCPHSIPGNLLHSHTRVQGWLENAIPSWFASRLPPATSPHQGRERTHFWWLANYLDSMVSI